jgi:hypothetical protein
VSGNPGGRPKKSLLQEKLRELANDKEFVAKAIEAAKQRMLSERMSGVLEMREFLDRVDGKVKDEIEITDGSTPEGLAERIRELESELGIAGAVGQASGAEVTAGETEVSAIPAQN